MKNLINNLTAVLLTVCLCVVVVSAATAYTSSVAGFETSRGKNGDVLISTRVSGDLPGNFTIRVSHENGVISGGEWSRDVLGQDENGAARELGTLKGAISSGQVNLDGSGNLGSITAQLAINSGTAAYASINQGTGTFGASTNQQSHSEVNGTLNMNF
ncbi:MAG: hypothetical protein M3388_00915 [Acidobacteriota bacterium]|nr:hypothetical protein [Acidobacteriota bacterium]